MLEVGIGFSQEEDVALAAKMASEQAKKQLGRDRIDIAFLFNTSHYSPEICLPIVYDTLDQTNIIGSSTGGIFLSQTHETRGIAVVALYSDSIKFEASQVSHLNLQKLSEAGEIFAKNFTTDFGAHNRKLFLFFYDGLINNISQFLSGVNKQLGYNFPILGAGSSDDLRFKKTQQYYNNKIMNNGAAGVILGGNARIAVTSKHGWRPLGRPRTVTAVNENLIQAIDGKPAYKLYQEYFDHEAAALSLNRYGQINVRYPLGTPIDERQEYILRNITTVLDDKSLVCQDTITQGSRVHIMITDKEACIGAARQAARDIKAQLGEHRPQFVLMIESINRQKILGRMINEEIKEISNILGTDVPLVGICSYGEIFTFQKANYSFERHLQNNCITLIALG